MFSRCNNFEKISRMSIVVQNMITDQKKIARSIGSRNEKQKRSSWKPAESGVTQKKIELNHHHPESKSDLLLETRVDAAISHLKFLKVVELFQKAPKMNVHTMTIARSKVADAKETGDRNLDCIFIKSDLGYCRQLEFDTWV